MATNYPKKLFLKSSNLSSSN